eukprot:SAG31_NODE_4661_length_3058_cov_2.518756_2_plen_306_part_00
MLSLGNTSNVLLERVTMLNAASFHIDIGDCGALTDGGLPTHGTERCGVCENYTIRYLTIRSPNFEKARNTDGIDIAATNVHLHDCDVSNGDDSICVKSPSSNLLIENSTVRQGNGLVIGTSSDAAIENVTFRNILADDTTFGCHIKFRPDQAGYVKDVVFDNVSVYQSEQAYLRRIVDPNDHAGYAIGIHQDDQGLSDSSSARPPPPPDPGKGVHVTRITYRRIRSKGLFGGSFLCTAGALACTDITLEDVHLNVSRSGCKFVNVQGQSVDVEPRSCHVPGTLPATPARSQVISDLAAATALPAT